MIERRVRLLLAIPEMGILVALVLVTAVFWLLNPALLTGGSVATLLRALAFVGVIAIGQTLLLIVGELDLSVGSVAGLCAVVAAWLMKEAGTIALAEQALATGDVAGIAIWAGSPATNPLIERAGSLGVPVILPHFPVPEGSVPGAKGVISCDPAPYAIEAAERIGQAIAGKGSVAITQGSFNSNENLVAETFTKAMRERFPDVNVLEPIEEGFDPPAAISRAVALMRANPDLAAAISTTGGGALTWSAAQRDAGRKIVVVGMDYTRVNLDLVQSGEIHAVVGQPLWEESYGAAELLDKLIRGNTIEWWTKLPAPFITRDDLAPHYERLDKVESLLGKRTSR